MMGVLMESLQSVVPRYQPLQAGKRWNGMTDSKGLPMLEADRSAAMFGPVPIAIWWGKPVPDSMLAHKGAGLVLGGGTLGFRSTRRPPKDPATRFY